LTGIGENFHNYQARCGLFDIDYLGHLNNAAFLSHAEYTRWEMSAANNLLPAMYRSKTNFLVSGTAIRFRREVRPLWRKFQVDTSVVALDERYMWILHKFRYPEAGRNRVRAHIIAQGVAVRGREVIDPQEFFKQNVGINEDVIDRISLPSEHIGRSVEEMIERFSALDGAMRSDATLDDESHEGI
jgi:acyl-CoA thioesterase FadM